jgi:hypothetical protein
MTPRLILPAVLLLLLTACNNSSDDKKTDDTAATTGHDMNHAPTTSGAVPELPVVPEGSKVYFKNLKDGEMVSSPVKIEMGLDVMRIDTAGPVAAGSGHHHLLIDVADSIATGLVTAKDSVHIHYGRGQTEAEVPLSPGKHKLTLQFADGLHRSYGGRMATTITVNVKK